jgi:predicted small secreted protein
MSRSMVKILVLLLMSVSLCAGCETAKGATKDVKNIAHNSWNAVCGVSGGVHNADQWVRENLW